MDPTVVERMARIVVDSLQRDVMRVMSSASYKYSVLCEDSGEQTGKLSGHESAVA